MDGVLFQTVSRTVDELVDCECKSGIEKLYVSILFNWACRYFLNIPYWNSEADLILSLRTEADAAETVAEM